jgi:UDP-N-acetylmuramate: L-alanyl-gamma-D-glutamyl-meso-diaminopimelate ligase
MLAVERNRIPEVVRSVHLIAVCGTAMGALAAMLQEMGVAVSGSDRNVYPPMSHFLAARGIEVREGFDPRNLDHRPDLVVVGNAVTADNPEARALAAAGMAYCSLPQALNHFAGRGRETLLVAGTHGKTTTSALLAWVLHAAGLDPSFMIGGILPNFDSNYRLGAGRYFVVEGDEYDTAFFDKGPKFLHFRPLAAVITSVEFDHADIFKDLAAVRRAFGQFIARLGPGSTIVAWEADANLNDLLEGAAARVERYGSGNGALWKLSGVERRPPETRFTVHRGESAWGSFVTPLMGEHNLLNTLAVVAVAQGIGLTPEQIAQGLATFRGVRRRQEVRGVRRGVTVMDDFAHHPTAVRETIRAVKPFFPAGRLIAVFEPRTNTSMRRIFQERYAEAFQGADLICIRQPPLLSKVPEGERFSSPQLVEDLRRAGQAAHYFEDTEGIVAFVGREAREGDLVLVMSNGGFDNIHVRLLERLGADASRG